MQQSIKLHRDGTSARGMRIAENGYRWYVIPGLDGIAHPWDAAHALSRTAAAKGYHSFYAEPNLLQDFPWEPFTSSDDQPLKFDEHWPPNTYDNAPWDWHLDKSKLRD